MIIRGKMDAYTTRQNAYMTTQKVIGENHQGG